MLMYSLLFPDCYLWCSWTSR